MLTCGPKVHGDLVEPGTGVLEVKCRSSFCGASSSVVVFHRFDLGSGELVETRKFKNPPRKER